MSTIEQAFIIAQDIESCLKSFFDRKTTPRTKKPSKQIYDIISKPNHVARNPRTETLQQSYCCEGYDHIVKTCPKQNFLIEEDDWVEV